MKKTILSILLTGCSLTAPAAVTDLADKPLASGTSSDVKPNVMFVLDDSGSMDWMFMPDDLDNRYTDVGARNPQCNTVYYNRDITYLPPKNPDGTRKDDRSFTAACDDGHAASPSCTVDLGTSFSHEARSRRYDSSVKPAYYYVYSGTQTLTPLSTVCKTSLGVSVNSNGQPTSLPATVAAAGGGTWTRVDVSATSGPGGTDERTNFANWYSYYRTRLMMMKSSVGDAFAGIGNKYRIGFITINPGSPVSSSKFLKPDSFETTHKTNWFNKLYGTGTSGSTPLREALSRVGRYYAGMNAGINSGMIPAQADDPVQYSCQQNFTILTTDGYWNGNSGDDLGGNSMGNHDNVYSAKDAYNPESEKFYTSVRPMFDGASQVQTTTDKSNEYRLANCTIARDKYRLLQWQQRSASTTRTETQVQKNDGELHKFESRLQRRTLGVERRTSSNSGSSWSGWSSQSSCTVDTSNPSLTQCRYASSWSAWANTASTCNVVAQQGSSAHGAVYNTATDCQYAAYVDGGGVSSCTAVAQSAGPTSFSTTTARTCDVVWGAWVDVSSCTLDTSGQTRRDCRDQTISVQPNAASCSASSSGGRVVTCTQTPSGDWSNATGPCMPSSTTMCQSLVTQDWTNIASCTPEATNASGIEKECQYGTGSESGQRGEYRTTTTTTSQSVSGGIAVGGATTTTSGPTSWATMTIDGLGTCKPTVDGPPTLPTPSPRRPVSGEPPLPTAPCTEWPCVVLGAATGGASGTLADVAQYYYITDLRASGAIGALGLDVSANNVPKSDLNDVEADKASWQHMTTFTMGLGLSGTLAYDKNYKNGAGDFSAIRAGTKNWPAPVADDPTALDDLWHAAVNGRGQYFSASSPQSVSEGLAAALAGINNRVASAAAAATSNLEPVAGDNFAYTAKYVTNRWTGDMEAKEIDLTTGKISATALWSTAQLLTEKTKSACDTRTIKLFRAGATDNLVDFKWNTYSCDADGNPSGAAVTTLDASEQANFGVAKVGLLGQYADMTDGSGGTVNQRGLAVGAPLVNFLRGQRGNETFEANSATGFYRERFGVLGDVVNAQPVFVKAPFALYHDTDYAAYKTDNSSRTPMVYVGANDGMLHAFNASTGEETWAFMPSVVLPELYRLADRDYSLNHRYFVDGTPAAGDVFDGTNWRTILVGGLNKGGKIYYALDVTDPAAPKALWEFSDANMGYSYGNPLIGKLEDGTWAVFLTSGINNPDGKGYLYILDAVTGALIRSIATPAGSAGDPSNLMKIAGWSDDDPIVNNTVNHIYGTDLKGNIWRFDINDSIEPAGHEATLLMTVTDADGNAQPISTRPEVALVGTSIYVYVGTGQYLGESDLATTSTQSVYGIRDPMTEPLTPGGMVVTNGRDDLQQQTMTQEGESGSLSAIRKITGCNSAPNGWYVDLPDSAERINVDMKLQLGSLIAASNVPLPDACRVGGYSWLNYFSITNGCAINSESKKVSERLSDSLAVGINVVRLPNSKTVVIATTSDAAQTTLTPPFSIGDPQGRRLTWREIIPAP